MSDVIRGEVRTSVQVTFNDGRIFQAPVNTPLEAFIHAAEQETATPPHQRAVAAMIDNRLRELSILVSRDMQIQPVTLLDHDGTLIYRRSLCFLLVAAAETCFPGVKVSVEYSLPQRAFFCRVANHPSFTQAEVDQVKAQMREFVESDLPITRTRMSLEDARDYFGRRDDLEKVRLLQFRTRDYLNIYTLGDYSDYFFGYMVPASGYLQWFDVSPTEDGFLLHYPPEERPDYIQTPTKLSKLAEVFHQTDEWLSLLEVTDIGQLNEAIQQGRLPELILVAEALHERRIAEIGQQVAERHATGARLVLIAGPSSSGKTTFSKRLAVQLMTHGLRPFTLEMDNYFVDRDKTPLDEKGDFDFESLYAINLELFNEHLQKLIVGDSIELPKFDFKLGKSSPGRQVQLSADHVVIVEGIHGNNPELTTGIAPERLFRIYISALSTLNIDRHNRVSTTDMRLLRRIVRDANHRGWTATDTLTRWSSVRRGEKRNIFPFQENADVMFNSSLFYELAVMRPLAEPHLLRVNLDHPKWFEANRLMSFLNWVLPVSGDGIPDNSILREFIGGSILQDYHPGA